MTKHFVSPKFSNNNVSPAIVTPPCDVTLDTGISTPRGKHLFLKLSLWQEAAKRGLNILDFWRSMDFLTGRPKNSTNTQRHVFKLICCLLCIHQRTSWSSVQATKLQPQWRQTSVKQLGVVSLPRQHLSRIFFFFKKEKGEKGGRRWRKWRRSCREV